MKRLFNNFLLFQVKKIKGFLKDPFFYLISISLILFVVISFTPNFNQNNDSLASLSPIDTQNLGNSQNSSKPFIESVNIQSESPEFYLIQESSLLGLCPPVTVTPQVLGTILGEPEPEIKKEVVEYAVQDGDNLSNIAEEFGISIDTILWANNLSKNSIIKSGQTLIILPVSGVLHYVKAGDTISEIAEKYKVKSEDIVAFNELSSEGDIYVGDILIVPGGIMPTQKTTTPTYAEVPLASSYFICPITSPCRITQGLHWYNAIDFSHGKCGDSIYAAAGGIVQRVRYGWNSGAGNTITILHPNGVVTSYGHILTSLVDPGDQVSQGQMIAFMGGQPGTTGAGKSTGCHVHFQVIGARNPFVK